MSDTYKTYNLVDGAWTVNKNNTMVSGYYNSEEAALWAAENLTEQQILSKLYPIYAYEKAYRFVSMDDLKSIFK